MQQWRPMPRGAACTGNTTIEGNAERLSQGTGGTPLSCRQTRWPAAPSGTRTQLRCAQLLAGPKLPGTREQCTFSCSSTMWDRHIASTCLNSSLMSSLWGSNKSKMRSHLAANQPQTSMKL